MNVNKLPGVDTMTASSLEIAGITDTNDLLSKCATPQRRSEVVETTGVPMRKLIVWTHYADMMRIAALRPKDVWYLHAAGAGTLRDLVRADADTLHKKMKEIREERELKLDHPDAVQIAAFIEAGQTLQPAIIG